MRWWVVGRRGQAFALASTVPLALAAGCGARGGAAGPVPAARMTVAGVSWEVPASWRERPVTGLRAAVFTVAGPAGAGDGECTVFHFGPGRPGTVAANIRRWEAQFPEAAERSTVTWDVAGLRVSRIEMRGRFQPSVTGGGGAPDAMLVGVAIEGPRGPVYLKCVGPRTAIEATRPELDALVASLRAD